MRTWFKCRNCKNTWFDDADNTFPGCPICGGDFDIIDEESVPQEGESSVAPISLPTSSATVVMSSEESQKLCDAVDEFAEEMKNRLLAKENQGWRGWENQDKKDLANRMLKNAVYGRKYYNQESLIDVANLAMMILRQG